MPRWVNRMVVFFFLLAAFTAGFQLARAESVVNVLESGVVYSFGEQIVFRCRLQSQVPIQRVEVLYRPVDAAQTFSHEMTLEQEIVSFTHDLELDPQFIPVFSVIEYRFRITLQDGQVVYSEIFTFKYLDNRFTWQSLEELPFRVFWVEGDLSLGQAVLDAARLG